MIEELKDKEAIITDLKNENEYYSEENSQMKSIISDLKQEKNKVFEEKNLVINDLRDEIDKWKIKTETFERDLLYKVKENDNFKKNIEAVESKSDGYKKKLQELE